MRNDLKVLKHSYSSQAVHFLLLMNIYGFKLRSSIAGLCYMLHIDGLKEADDGVGVLSEIFYVSHEKL